jgi:Mg-chelatase subunit ChlD
MKIPLFIFSFLFCLKFHAQDSINPCNVYDVVVVLDQSGSVSDDFSLACLEIADFFKNLSIGQDAVHAGFVTFNSNPFIVHVLSHNKTSLIHSANIMSDDKASSTTNLLSALHVTFDLFQESERWLQDIPKVCVVITDGFPTESVDTVRRLEGDPFAYPSILYADFMKDNGIVFFTISMGSREHYSKDYLERLASSQEHFFFAKYTELSQVLAKINVCQ